MRVDSSGRTWAGLSVRYRWLHPWFIARSAAQQRPHGSVSAITDACSQGRGFRCWAAPERRPERGNGRGRGDTIFFFFFVFRYFQERKE